MKYCIDNHRIKTVRSKKESGRYGRDQQQNGIFMFSLKRFPFVS